MLHRSQLVDIILLAVFTLSLTAKAGDNPGSTDLCKDPFVKSISVPVDPGNTAGPRVALSFYYRLPATPQDPTVIFLAGGPGSSGIASVRTSTIPKHFGAVFIDPRGIGCSTPPPGVLPDSAFSTNILVNDALAVIQSLNLKDPILYGHSYGTILATVLAYRLERIANPATALVLEGVIGRSFQKGEALASFQKEWLFVRSQLNAKSIERLSREENLLGLSGKNWDSYIVRSLYAGLLPGYGSPLVVNLQFLGQDDPMKIEQLKKTVQANAQATSQPGYEDAMFKQIQCSEISPDTPDIQFVNGMLKGNSLCETETLQTPFYAGQWKILKTPIYYFVGRHDPATPVWQGQVHFQSQTLATRSLLEVHDAGHSVISRLKDCSEDIWIAISLRGKMDEAIKSCTVQTSLFNLLPSH